jgi:hypothetical protein
MATLQLPLHVLCMNKHGQWQLTVAHIIGVSHSERVPDLNVLLKISVAAANARSESGGS